MEIERFFHKKDRHYAKTYLEEQAKYEVLHEESRQGIHACRVQRVACSALDDHLTQLISEVKTNITAQTQLHRQDRHVAETHREKLAEKAIAEVRGLMIEEQESRKETHGYAEQVSNEICHLYNDLDKARNYRHDKSEKLQAVVQEKLNEIHVAIQAEKKIREEDTSKVLELFGEMGTKMQKEIDQVKVERKASTDRLLSLMEVVLPHLEQARLNHVKLVHEKMEEQKATAALATFATENFRKRQSVKDAIKRKSMQPKMERRSSKEAREKRLSSCEESPSRQVSPSQPLTPTSPAKFGIRRSSDIKRMSMDEMKTVLPVIPVTQTATPPPPATPPPQARSPPLQVTSDPATLAAQDRPSSRQERPASRQEGGYEGDRGTGVSLPSL